MPINNYTQKELMDICENLYGQISNKYTIYVTYQLFSSSGVKPIHCNYIKWFDSESYENVSVNLRFPADGFKYLEGGGYSANQLGILVNVVENQETSDGYKRKPPKSNEWRIYTTGVNVTQLKTESFTQSLVDYDEDTIYDLGYLDYPDRGEDIYCFGDEPLFLGSIETEIEAVVYCTDLPIKLSLNEFNYSTNETWDGETSVYITEIGIYDDDDNLVAIGKLSEPLEKNQDILRTIVFSMDF